MYVGCGARALRVSRGTQATLIPTELAREEQHGWTTAAAATLLRIVGGVRGDVGRTVGDVGQEQHRGAVGQEQHRGAVGHASCLSSPTCHGHPCQAQTAAQRKHSTENTFYREGGVGGQERSASQTVEDVRGEGGLGHVEHGQHRQHFQSYGQTQVRSDKSIELKQQLVQHKAELKASEP